MMARDSRSRSSVKKQPVSKVRRYWWLAPVAAALALLGATITGPEWSRPRTGKASDMGPLPGYVMNYATVTQEYLRFNGKPLKDDVLAAQFNQAAQHMSKRDYGSAAQ